MKMKRTKYIQGRNDDDYALHIMTLFYHFELHNYFHSSSTSLSLLELIAFNACSLKIIFFLFFSKKLVFEKRRKEKTHKHHVTTYEKKSFFMEKFYGMEQCADCEHIQATTKSRELKIKE